MVCTYEIQNRVATITLQRPEKKNALNFELAAAVRHFIDRAEEDSNVRLIEITGSGDVFSAGADLQMLKDLETASFEENVTDSRHLMEMFKIFVTSKKPILGIINGHAIAGGCGLATACDITLVNEHAKVGYTETRIGFVPAIVSKLVVNKVGDTRARKLLLGGELLTAREAVEWGLFTECVSDENMDVRRKHWREQLTKNVSGTAVAQTKQLLNEIENLSTLDAFELAVNVNAHARSTDDCKKGISAFLDRKKMEW